MISNFVRSPTDLNSILPKKTKDVYNPDVHQLVISCTILANPPPRIRWTAQRVPLWLASLPRVKILTHADDVEEHLICQLVINDASYLDNGDYIIELENEAGCEKRTITVNFQTEEEYNELYFKRYMEHKEITKYHIYRPGEVRWEDVVPEVHEFIPYVPEELQPKGPTIRADGKLMKRVKPKKKVKKMVMTPWGDEKEEIVEETDYEAESIEVTDNEDEEEEEVSESTGGGGWLVEGETVMSSETATATQSMAGTVMGSIAGTVVGEGEVVAVQDEIAAEDEEEEEIVEKEPTPVPEPEPEVQPEPEPEPEVEEVAEEPEPIVEEEQPVEPPAPVVEAPPPAPAEPEFEPIWDDIVDEDPTDEYGKPPEEPEVYAEEPQEPVKKDTVEHPIILRKPKYQITDFQLRRKFFMVNKLVNVEQLKGTTLKLESFSASVGPITCEWRHNGRLIHAPTARKNIYFYSIRNQAVLEIENTRVQDSGTYTCTHYNNYTEPLIDSCKVTITVPKVAERADQPPTFTRLLTGTCHKGYFTHKLARIPNYSTHPSS